MRKHQQKYLIPAVIVLIVLINYGASFFHWRLDLTNENRFTISEPVKKMLINAEEPAEVILFLQGNLPAGFRKLAASATDLLEEFKDISRGKVTFRTLSAYDQIPGENRTWGDTLMGMGITPINLTVQLKQEQQSQYVFPAALIRRGDRWQAAELYKGAKNIITPAELNTAEALLEYHLADALLKTAEKAHPLVGYATGNGEPMGIETFDLVENVLKKDYSLFTMNLAKEPFIPDTFDVVLMVKPTLPFREEQKLKLDQYVMRGGRLLLFIDRLEAEMDSLQLKNEVIAYDRNLELNDWLFKYGVRINPDLLLDLQSDFLPFRVSAGQQFEFLNWNYFPLFEGGGDHLINKGLGLVAGRFVNTLDSVAAPGIRKTVLLSSGPNAKTLSTPALISGDENRHAPDDQTYQQKHLPVAMLLEGKFSSLFMNRLSTAERDTLEKYGRPFESQSIDSKIIVVSDGDIPLNSSYQGRPLPMGVNPYTVETQYEYQFSNRQFVTNCLEYLVNRGGLMAAKGKDYQMRLLDSKKVAGEKTGWQIANTAIPSAVILAVGAISIWLRRRKYGSTPVSR